MSLIFDVGTPDNVEINKNNNKKQTIKIYPNDNVLTIKEKLRDSYQKKNAVFNDQFTVILLDNKGIKNFNEYAIGDKKMSFCINNGCDVEIKPYDELRNLITYHATKKIFIFFHLLFHKNSSNCLWLKKI